MRSKAGNSGTVSKKLFSRIDRENGQDNPVYITNYLVEFFDQSDDLWVKLREEFGPLIKVVLEKMLHWNPEDRATAAELLEHEFF